MLDPNDLVGRRPLRGQALVQPYERWRHGRILFAQSLDQLHREGGHERGVADPLQGRQGRVGRAVGESEDGIRDRVGFLTRDAPADDDLGEATEILDEHDPQRDRHRPELADGERLDALVGAHESAERGRVQATIRVGDEGPGDPIDPRIAVERAGGELGQLPIESRRQIVPDLAQLLVHDVEVIDEPFRRRGDRPLLPDGPGHDAVGLAQEASVVLDPPQQLAALRRAHDGLGRGQALGMLLESLDAEQLGTNRLFGRGRHDQRHTYRRAGFRPRADGRPSAAAGIAACARAGAACMPPGTQGGAPGEVARVFV